MRILTKLNVAGAGLTLYAMNALTALAQNFPQPVTPPGADVNAPVTNGSGILTLINTLAKFVAYLFWGLTVIFIFYAAFLYLTARGEEEKIKKANHQLVYAVIAIVVALFAYGLPFIVQTTLKGQ